MDLFFIYTSVDSFMIMKNNKDEFDTNTFSKDHECYSEKNTNVIRNIKMN